jgi:hypothetical protein
MTSKDQSSDNKLKSNLHPTKDTIEVTSPDSPLNRSNLRIEERSRLTHLPVRIEADLEQMKQSLVALRRN